MRRPALNCLLIVLTVACLLVTITCITWAVLRTLTPAVTPEPPTPGSVATATVPAATPMPSEGLESAILLTEQRLNAAIVPIHDPVALREELGAPPPSITSSVTPTPPPDDYSVGSRRAFRLDGPMVEAELVHVTEHTYTWLVEGVEADREALVAAAERFEAEIYPVVQGHFGSEWSPGIDDDVHISILHYADGGDDASGYFSPSDELPQSIDRLSNQTEMFYVNLSSMNPGDDYYFAVLAHEFEHMVHWNTDRTEADWLDEGLAELACRVSGFDPGDARESFLVQPDIQLTDWPYEGDTYPHYGSGYLFALFLWERFGTELIRDLVHHPADGLASLDAVLSARGADVSADDLFADWVVANALDEGEYAYEQEDWKVDLGIDATHDAYPVTRDADVSPYGTDYIEISGSGELLVRFVGAPEGQLLTVEPHSGRTAWWSNVGNRSDARLIRRFDLGDLSSATLRFWTWYDIEDGYDYVYLSASPDGGDTWQVLQGTSATGRGDYGFGYNGRSDGWVEEVVDLSAYAGGEVLIRFDYVTDDTINRAGFLLDDLSIPELDLVDSCEEEGDWQAEGWALVTTTVPQRWAVQLIEFHADGSHQVRRVPLAADQTGQAELVLGDGVERALLALSAMTRGPMARSPYTYTIETR